jgi:hypothetical protein
LLTVGFLHGKQSKDLAFATPGFPPSPEPSPAKRQDFLPARAIRDAGDVAACTSRAATSHTENPTVCVSPAFALRIGGLSGPHALARAAKAFAFFAASQTTVLRCKIRRHWLCRWRSHAALDVAAASRGFSQPHRIQVAHRALLLELISTGHIFAGSDMQEQSGIRQTS